MTQQVKQRVLRLYHCYCLYEQESTEGVGSVGSFLWERPITSIISGVTKNASHLLQRLDSLPLLLNQNLVTLMLVLWLPLLFLPIELQLDSKSYALETWMEYLKWKLQNKNLWEWQWLLVLVSVVKSLTVKVNILWDQQKKMCETWCPLKWFATWFSVLSICLWEEELNPVSDVK